MSRFHIIFLLIIILTDFASCSFENNLFDRVWRLKDRADRLYREKHKAAVKLWEYELEDRLAYPRGDKHKLSEISQLWLDYYTCSAQQVHELTASGNLPAVSLTAYVGSVERLPCGVCVSPDDKGITWLYAQSLLNLKYVPMVIKETAVREQDGSITLYYVRVEDAGVYRCQIGRSMGGPVVLEVVDYDENYSIVKPSTSRGPFPSPWSTVGKELELVTRWAPWSECSRCGTVGRRRRYGMCYVGLSHRIRATKKQDDNSKANGTNHFLHNIKKLFDAFPRGLGCRSKYLPAGIRSLPAVANRRNEIMLGMCKEPCQTNVIFRLMSLGGRVYEEANNSAGIYSMAQKPPKTVPPVRDIVFATRGESVTIRCPGTSLRDIPVTWRAGDKTVVPRELHNGSEGRVRLNARDHLVFDAVNKGHANLYSCWQADRLAGTVRLEVWDGRTLYWDTHVALLLAVIVAAVALQRAERALRRARRRAGLQ